MDLIAAQDLARHHMDANGLLPEWNFAYTNSFTFFGITYYQPKKQIKLSRQWTTANAEPAVLDTILHEIAHTIAGADAAHNREWKQIARELGAEPVAMLDANKLRIPAHPYFAMHYCGKVHHRVRLPIAVDHCGPCWERGLRGDDSRLVWIERATSAEWLTLGRAA